MVFSCCGPGESRNCQDKFSPVISDQGICYSFNPVPFNNSLEKSPYFDIFQSVFERDLKHKDGIIKMENTGKSFQMHITLDGHTSKAIDKSNKGVFTLAINQNKDYMSTLDTGVSIEPGLHTWIKITPSNFTSTERFDRLSLEQRECRYFDEFKTSTPMFK